MLTLYLAQILSDLVLISDIEDTENALFIPKTVPNCYGRNNILSVNIDLGEICLQFDPSFNEECMQIPDGIYLDIQLTNFPDSIIRGQFQTYKYKTDNTLCYKCPIIGSDINCDFIQKTEAAQVTIKSLTRQTHLPVGQIIINHATLSTCYECTKSQIFIGQTHTILYLYKSQKCPLVTKFDFCNLKMSQLSGQIDHFQISELAPNGTPQLLFTNYEEYLEIEILADFTSSYLKFFDLAQCEFGYRQDSISSVRTTDIWFVKSLDVPEMYLRPVFTVWASQFQLVAEPLLNAEELEEKYARNAARVDVRYEVFNKVSGVTISNVFFVIEEFSFLSIDMKMVCQDESDGGECSRLLELLQVYDLGQIEILMHYHFYDKDGKILVYASNNVDDARNTCWTGVQGIYHEKSVCGKFVKNSMATSCPYLKDTAITFSIEFDGYKMSQQLNYSVDDEQVCIECQNQSCIDRIYELYQAKSSVAFLFQSGTESFNLVSVNNYNQNYSKLHERVLFCGVAIIVLLVSIGVYQTLRFKGIIGDLRRAKKQQLVDNDDLR